MMPVTQEKLMNMFEIDRKRDVVVTSYPSTKAGSFGACEILLIIQMIVFPYFSLCLGGNKEKFE